MDIWSWHSLPSNIIDMKTTQLHIKHGLDRLRHNRPPLLLHLQKIGKDIILKKDSANFVIFSRCQTHNKEKKHSSFLEMSYSFPFLVTYFRKHCISIPRWVKQPPWIYSPSWKVFLTPREDTPGGVCRNFQLLVLVLCFSLIIQK